jgi:hypothetical protein
VQRKQGLLVFSLEVAIPAGQAVLADQTVADLKEIVAAAGSGRQEKQGRLFQKERPVRDIP